MKLKVKICGVTREVELNFLDRLGVSYAGLWYGIYDGKYNLDIDQFTELSSIPTEQLKKIMVTMLSDVDDILKPLKNCKIHGIQLHGFQLPSMVKRLTTLCGPDVQILKVLHINKGVCLEENLIERYLESGVTAFVLDNYENRGSIGSTGIPVNMDYLDWYNKKWKPVTNSMLAGGLSANNINKICRRYKPDAIDIDSAARFRGVINRRRVRNIMLSL